MSTPLSDGGAAPGHPPDIFISYRRADARWPAKALADALAAHFGAEHVFLDTKDLLPGDDFVEELQRRVSACDVFLPVIGPKWAEIMQERSTIRVTDGTQDHVRIEVETALSRDTTLRVIPVLLDDTLMPEPRLLPQSLERLTRIGALSFRSSQEDTDVAALIARIESMRDAPGPETETAPGPGPAIATHDVGPPPADPHYAEVAGHLRTGKVVLFLGSLVNRGARDDAWAEGGGELPDADELAAHLAEKFHYPGSSPDLAEVSQYVSSTVGENDLYDVLDGVFGGSYAPTAIHRFLAELPRTLAGAGVGARYQVVVTTNYDDALEQAFRDAGEPYDLAIYMAEGRARGRFMHLPWDGEFVQRKDCPDWSDRQPITVDDPNQYKSFPIDVESRDVKRTIIVKIHGAVAKYGDLNDVVGEQNFVITESDYIDYLSRSPIVGLVPNQLLTKMVRGHMLFLGQRVRDWSWRVFLQRVWDDRIRDSWAVTPGLDEFEQRFWHKLGVHAIDRSLTTYVDDLRAQLLAADLSEAR